MEIGLLLLGTLLSVLIRWIVSVFPYSGQGKAPMFGDYEAQRHWMEITYHLPVHQWYQNTSDNDLLYWGLDYPPLTAYHSYICGFVANSINPSWVALNSSRGFEGYHHKLFMRYTVLAADLLIFIPAVILFFHSSVFKERIKACAAVATFLYPGLILIDHGHFQYNCISLGFLVWTVVFVERGRDLLASVAFCLALNYKQMELYHSLPVFCFLLATCLHQKSITQRILKFAKLGVVVGLTFAACWLPFLTDFEGGSRVVGRIFPFDRGLFEDKVANIWCSLSILIKLKSLFSVTTLARVSAVTTFLLLIPSCVDLLKRPSLQRFNLALVNSSLVFFLCSFQVHEKSILLAAIPVCLTFPTNPLPSLWFLLITVFSMFPLLLKDRLMIPFYATAVIYVAIVWRAFVREDLKKNYQRSTIVKNLILILALCATDGAQLPSFYLLMWRLFWDVWMCIYINSSFQTLASPFALHDSFRAKEKLVLFLHNVMSSGRRTRPHSAATSVHSNGSHLKCIPRSDEVTPTSVGDNQEHLIRCKVAYLTVKRNVTHELTSQEELAQALQQAGLNPSKKDVNSYWCNSKTIPMSFSRFCDVVEAESASSRISKSSDVPFRAFLKLDPDGTGKIGRKQLLHLMTTTGERMSEEEFARIFVHSPFMKDDFFHYIEFCHSVEKTSEKCLNKALEVVRELENKKNNLSQVTPAKRKERPKTCIPHYMGSAIDSFDVTDGLSSDLKDWARSKSNGNFYFDEDGNVVTHQYVLELPTASNVWLTIEPLFPNPMGPDPVDCLIYVLKEGDGGGVSTTYLVSFTENRDDNGCHYLGTNLESGRYILQPFTSGCRLKNEKDLVHRRAVNLTRKSTIDEGGQLQLTDDYCDVLRDIFKVIDLDGNGRLNRQEFTLFQWQSCGEEVDDTEWRALRDNFEMEDDELTLNGFMDAHLLEAENNEGDEDDLWKTLHCMGYDDSLQLVRACPFLLTVCTEEQGARLRVRALKNSGPTLEKAICRQVVEMGTSSKIRNLNDLILYTYIGRHNSILVVQNKAHSAVAVRLDCSHSQNCCSHRGNLDYVLHVPPKTTKVGHHLMPINEKDSWKIICNETLVK